MRSLQMTLAAVLAALPGLAGCSPEVVIAHTAAVGGGGAAGTGGTESGGSGDMPTTAGEATEGGAAAMPEPARLLADSVADFSLVQGAHGWYYGYDSGTLDTFTLMTRTSVITTYVPVSNDVWDCWANDTAHWTQIFQLGAHPNGTNTSTPSPPVLQRAVRRWISTYSGVVVISGEVAKIDVTLMGSNGVDASVYVDGSQQYTTFIGGEDAGGLSYEVTVTVAVGSTVDFVLDPHDSDDHHDLSRFTGIVARAPSTTD